MAQQLELLQNLIIHQAQCLAALEAENIALRANLTQLQAENATLRTENAALKAHLDEAEPPSSRASAASPRFVQAHRPKKSAGEPRRKRTHNASR